MNIILLDGGMGQELISRSKNQPTALWSTLVLMREPELVKAVHRDYFKVGADLATTNTYAIHHDRLEPFDLEDKFKALHIQACELAAQARDEHGSGQVAGSLGPTGWSYRPDLAPPPDEAAELYAEIARIQAEFVDIFLCETMSSVEQAKGAVMGAASQNKPVWLAVSVKDDDGSRLRSGEDVADVLDVAKEYGVAALLVNCSTPEAVDIALGSLLDKGLLVGAYANGFTQIKDKFKDTGATVDQLEKRAGLTPNVYADFVDGWLEQGAGIVGGCCEIGPAHIREIATRLAKL